MSNGYNGWSNYETWKTNMELLDGYEVNDFMSSGVYVFPEDRDQAVTDLARHFSDYAYDYVAEQATGWALDLANNFLARVDFDEIAGHYVDDYITEFMYHELKELA